MTNPFFYRILFQDAVGRSSLSTQVNKKKFRLFQRPEKLTFLK